MNLISAEVEVNKNPHGARENRESVEKHGECRRLAPRDESRILPSEMGRLQREGLLVPRPLDGEDDVDQIHVPQEIADRIFPSRSRIE